MREEKRTIPKLVKVVLAVIAIFIIVYPIASNNFKRDISNIQDSYESKKQKMELLQEISRNCIDEGIGININKDLSPILEEGKGYVDKESIYYEIYRKDENIIFYYIIREPSQRENRYYATITLSKEYKILNEEYSIKFEDLEDFETYKQQCKRDDKIIIIIFSIWISVAILCMGKAIIEMISDGKTLINNKRSNITK